jgi:hypothetical protein
MTRSDILCDHYSFENRLVEANPPYYEKSIRFYLNNFFFGKFENQMMDCIPDEARYETLAQFYTHLTSIGIYPSGTKFSCTDTTLDCKMPVLLFPDRFPAGDVERILLRLRKETGCLPLHIDICDPENYMVDSQGTVRLVDLHIFPLKSANTPDNKQRLRTTPIEELVRCMCY